MCLHSCQLTRQVPQLHAALLLLHKKQNSMEPSRKQETLLRNYHLHCMFSSKLTAQHAGQVQLPLTPHTTMPLHAQVLTSHPAFHVLCCSAMGL